MSTIKEDLFFSKNDSCSRPVPAPALARIGFAFDDGKSDENYQLLPSSGFGLCNLVAAGGDAQVGTSMDLSLGADGTATVTEDPGNGTTTLFGHWVDSGSQVKVTFDAVEGKPAEPPMVFEAGHDGLHAVTWNHATW